MAKSSNRAEVGIELNATDNVSETTKKVEKRINQYQKACQKVSSFGSGAIDKIGARFTDFSVALSNSIVLFNDQIVKPLTSMISNFSQAGFQLEKMARSAHLSVDQLGALSFAAEQTGSNANSVASAMQNMESKIYEASRGSLSAMQEIYHGCGKTFQEMKRLSPEERLMAVADVIQRVGDEAQKADIAKRMFGSDDLLPLLKQGRDGIQALMAEGRDLGGPFSPENVEKSKQLAQAFNRIKTLFESIKTTFLTSMADTITDLLTRVKDFMKRIQTFINEHPRLTKSIALITAGVVGLITAGGLLIPILMGVNTLISSLLAVVGAFLSPWILLPTLIIGGLAAFGQFNSVLGGVWDYAKKTFSSILDGLQWLFGDSIALISNGEFSAAWENLWAKVQIVFIQAKQTLSNIINQTWSYLLETVASAINRVTTFLDDLFFNGNEVFGKFFEVVKSFFSSMLEEVGASSGSISEVFLAGWFSIKKGFINIWYGIKSSFFQILGSIQKYWISFRKELQAGVNWIYGKLSGLSDEEIGQMTLITDREFDEKAKSAEDEQNAALAQIETDRTEAIESARSDIKARIQNLRDQPKKDEEKIEALTKQIEETRTLIQEPLDPNNPESPYYQSGGGPANFLNQQLKDASHGTQNSFQAMFGFGQTTEQKQLEVSQQILQLFELLIGNAGM